MQIKIKIENPNIPKMAKWYYTHLFDKNEWEKLVPDSTMSKLVLKIPNWSTLCKARTLFTLSQLDDSLQVTFRQIIVRLDSCLKAMSSILRNITKIINQHLQSQFWSLFVSFSLRLLVSQRLIFKTLKISIYILNERNY